MTQHTGKNELPDHLKLLVGDKGREKELKGYLESPTVIVDEAWDQFAAVANSALDAYMNYCKVNGIPHSYFLGLDILVMGSIDAKDPRRVFDIRPTLVEGPCCNSYPACPNLWSSRLYGQMKLLGFNPDAVEYPTHPLYILQKIANLFRNIWKVRGNTKRNPVVAVFTRPYDLSEEETAHEETLQGFRDAGFEAYRVTPAEHPEVKEGKLWVHGKPIDMVWRRIERIHVPGQANPPGRDDESWVEFYGKDLAYQIVNETPNTIWVNPWKVDDLRSKTIEERAFRLYEQSDHGAHVSRPLTLLDKEVTKQSVAGLAETGGWVMKRWNSTGGKGVFMHMNLGVAKHVADRMYCRYDGRHMILLDDPALAQELDKFDSFNEDTAVQQMRFVDARHLGGDNRLVYDTRINVLYDPLAERWEFLSGISRSVACGPNVASGNSLLTNISAGAEVSPLIMGHTRRHESLGAVTYGPLLTALMRGENETIIE